MRFRLSIASAALVASSAYAQAPAIEVPPMRPPLVRPVVNPPSFPTPGATPAGAGIVVPTPEGGEQVVPRSPNKRILPATKEPGLWAADGAPMASGGDAPSLFGVALPEPTGAAMLVEASRACVSTVEAAAKSIGADKGVAVYPPLVRKCMAAWAYLMCAKHRHEAMLPSPGADDKIDYEKANAVSRLVMHALQIERAACRDVTRTEEQMDVLDAIDAQWLLLMRTGGNAQ